MLPLQGQQGFFYMHHPIHRIVHTTAFVTSHGALVGTRNSSTEDRSDNPSHHELHLTPPAACEADASTTGPRL